MLGAVQVRVFVCEYVYVYSGFRPLSEFLYAILVFCLEIIENIQIHLYQVNVPANMRNVNLFQNKFMDVFLSNIVLLFFFLNSHCVSTTGHMQQI